MTTWEQYARRQDSRKIYLAHIDTLAPDGSVDVLRVSTAPIRPGETDVPYLPILSGDAMPAYSTSIQEVLQGRSQDGFGELAINILDGRMDARIADDKWSGRRVAVYMGFAGLHVNDYRLLFSGRQQRIEYDDRILRIPIISPKLSLVRRMQGQGNYSGAAPEIVAALLTLANITDIDPAAWDAWASENDFTISYSLDNAMSVGTLLDEILGRIACFWRFTREGKFTLGTFAPPDPAAEPALKIDTALHGVGKTDAVKVRRLDRYWRVRVQYHRAAAKTVSQQDAAILAEDPLALDGGAIETYLVHAADAETVLQRWWALRSVPRTLVEIRSKVLPLTLELADPIALTHRRHGFDATPLRVVSLNEDYNANRVIVGGWM